MHSLGALRSPMPSDRRPSLAAVAPLDPRTQASREPASDDRTAGELCTSNLIDFAAARLRLRRRATYWHEETSPEGTTA